MLRERALPEPQRLRQRDLIEHFAIRLVVRHAPPLTVVKESEVHPTSLRPRPRHITRDRGRLSLVESGDAAGQAPAPRERLRGEPSSPFERGVRRASRQQLEEATPPPLGDGGPSSPGPERVTATGQPRRRARGGGARPAASPESTRL